MQPEDYLERRYIASNKLGTFVLITHTSFFYVFLYFFGFVEPDVFALNFTWSPDYLSHL